jgi:hypothetical protein
MTRVLLALACVVSGCDTVDLGSAPADLNACRPDRQFFVDRIWPELLDKDIAGKKCTNAGCHDGTSGGSLRLLRPQSMARLPLPEDWEGVYKATAGVVNCTSATSSPLLAKPDGRQTHGGGKLFEVGGPETLLVKMWLEVK